MYAIKPKLKLNNVEISQMRGNAGFKRWVYNFGLTLLQESWGVEGIKASDSQRSETLKKVLTQVLRPEPKNAWRKKHLLSVSRKAYRIPMEELNVSGMMANSKLAAAVSNNCFSEIRRPLIYKQVHYSTKVELVEHSKVCTQSSQGFHKML